MYLFRKEQIIQYIPVATVCLVHNPLLLFQIRFFFQQKRAISTLLLLCYQFSQDRMIIRTLPHKCHSEEL